MWLGETNDYYQYKYEGNVNAAALAAGYMLHMTNLATRGER